MNEETKNLSLLLEIGTEEIPARFLPAAIQSLKENATTMLKENHIDFSEIRTYATPRRLTLIATGLPERQKSYTKELIGPPKKIAFDCQGNPTEAAIRFASSYGVNVESLVIKKKDKGEYVAIVFEEKAISVKELLPELLKRLILSIHFPKTMRWGNSSIRFARPIQWLLAIFGKDVIHFEIDGIKSTNTSRGHRFLSPSAFKVEDISAYMELLKDRFVIVDHEERKNIILDGIRKVAAQIGGKPVEDESLVETVNFLVEYPVAVLCSFEKSYLRLPRELLITVMKDHQRCFAVEDKEGRLTNYFIVISNTKEENSDMVRIGAERVVKARFEDARFYFEEDSKKTSYERIEDLKKVTFEEKIGSLYEKTKRIVSTVEFLAEKLLPLAKDKLSRAAWLSKTDLVTGVVREFPELQGIMGKYYAITDGEDIEVAKALEEQYMPTYSGGKIPQTEIGALLSVADKIDNIASFFSIGLIPTGSEDPFALRRQALGIIAIMLGKSYSISLKDLIDKALQNLSNLVPIKPQIEKEISHFFKQRLESVFLDQGYSTELIQSILPLSLDVQLTDIKERLDALKKFKEDSDYDGFLLAIKRVRNIIPSSALPQLSVELLIEEPEIRLKERLDSVKTAITDLLKDRKYYDAIKLLSSLKDPINHFFDDVLVMDKKELLRQNRLALLSEIWRTVSLIADFSRLK